MAVHHGDTADSGAEREHHHVGFALSGPGMSLAKQRETGVVVEAKRKTEFFFRPLGEVDGNGVGVLAIGVGDSGVPGIHESAKSEANSIGAGGGLQPGEGLSEGGKGIGEGLGFGKMDGLADKNLPAFDQRAGRVGSTQINRQYLHLAHKRISENVRFITKSTFSGVMVISAT
jgi:hypothetical protein